MSSSARRTAANRANASKSTGPVSEAGKAIACQNARRHGIFSARLFLEDEDPGEFEALRLELQETLGPVGTTEFALVERIAVTMWRQRRLVASETASLNLQRQTRELARAVAPHLGVGFGAEVQEEQLQPADQEQISWCEKVIAEIEALDEITLETLEQDASLVWRQLTEDAESDDETPADEVAGHDNGVTGYVMELYGWCQKELKTAAERPKLLALAAQLKEKRLILPLGQLQLLARYQTTLDNQLYKALKALREAQEWRLKTINSAAKPVTTAHTRAA